MTTAIRSHVQSVMTRHRMGETEEIMKQGIASAGTGAILGAINAKRKGGLDVAKIPLDLAGGIAVSAGSIFLPVFAQHRETVRDVASVAVGVGTFRLTSKVMGKTTFAGEVDEWGETETSMGAENDPVLRAARDL